MRYFILGLISILALASCKKSDKTVPVIDGTYKGTFQRISQGTGATGQVTMQFTGGNWVGNSEKTHYPALCNGTFTQQGDSLKVNNNCPWTAEFDATLIFGGGYAVTVVGNTLRLTKSINATTQDVYTLTKE